MVSKETNLPLELCLLAALAFLWGSSYILTKIAVGSIPPITLIAVRVSLAAGFLFLVLIWKGERLPKGAPIWGKLFIQAIFNSIGAWTVLAWGQQYVDSGLSSVLNSTSPIFVFFITLFFTRHEPTSVLKLMGACLGVLGVTLIIGVDALNGLGRQVFAQLAILFGAVLYACAAIYGKNFSHLSPIATALGAMICASLCLIPLSLALDRPWTLQPSNDAIVATLALALFGTAIAFLIYFRLVNTLGSLGVASQSYLRAGIGVAMGVMLLGEEITMVVGVGLTTAILGVAAINTPRRIR